MTAGLRQAAQRLGQAVVPRRPWARRAALVLALAVAAALLAWLATAAAPLPRLYTQLLALCALAGTAAWWFLYGAARFGRGRATRQRRGDLGPGDPAQETRAVEAMHAALRAAQATVLRSPEIERGRDPLYRVPWYVFIGDGRAQVQELLLAANAASPFPAPPRLPQDAPPGWSWWFFRQLVAIETSAAFVCPEDQRLTRGLWYRALELLCAHRDKLPLNGMAVTISVADLLANDEAFRDRCIRLRRLVDEAMEHLDAVFPVYFVVTGLQELPGFHAFLGALPKGVAQQALGTRLDSHRAITGASTALADTVFETLARRLHALRLTALCTEQRRGPRKGIYDFVEAFERLRPGLQAFVRHLLEDNPFQRTPQWRGLYFTAQGAQPAFVADLFTRILPPDQPLAQRTDRSGLLRWSKAGIGAGAALALSAFVAHGIFTAYHGAPALPQCTPGSGLGSGARIAWIADCGQRVDAYEAAVEALGLRFGVQRDTAALAQLKQRLLQEFSTYVLGPYELALQQHIAQRSVGLDHFLAVAQRLQMLDQCRDDAARCREQGLRANFVFDSRSRLFEPFEGSLSAEARQRQARELMQAYVGYIRWQQPAVLAQEARQLGSVLEQLSRARRLQPQDVADWAATRRPPLGLAAFWLDAPAPGAAAGDAAVPAAFTRPVWQEVVTPLARRLAGAGALQEEFFPAYARQYFEAWAGFLARFATGAAYWAGRDEALLARAASDGANPYALLWPALDEHLYALPLELPARTLWSRAWAGTRERWTQGPALAWQALRATAFAPRDRVRPPDWVAALAEDRHGKLQAQQPQFRSAYGLLLADVQGQDSYAIASELFKAGGNPSQPPAAVQYAQLLRSVDAPPERFAFPIPQQRAAWAVVQGPSRLLLALTLRRAATFLQARWDESVLRPLQAVPAAEQPAALRTRFDAYVNDWLKPFVTEKELAPRQLGGVSLPLAPAFRGVADAAGGAAATDPAELVSAGNFQIDRPTLYGAQPEDAGATLLEIACRERSFSVRSPGDPSAGIPVTVFWSAPSCPEVHLVITLPAAASGAAPAAGMPSQAEIVAMMTGQPAPPPGAAAAQPPGTARLMRVYPGRDGFRALADEFRDGVHTFALNQFKGTPQWQAIAQRAAARGFTQVTIHLRMQLTDEMRRLLYPPPAQRVPQAIFN